MPSRLSWTLLAVFVSAIGFAVWASATAELESLTDVPMEDRDTPDQGLPRRSASPSNRPSPRPLAVGGNADSPERTLTSDDRPEMIEPDAEVGSSSFSGTLAWPASLPQNGILSLTVRQTDGTRRVRTFKLTVNRTWSTSGLGTGNYALEFEWVSNAPPESASDAPQRLIGELASVTVSPGRSVTGLRVEMREPVRFEGTLLDQANLPVPDAELRIRLEGAMGLRVRKARSDARGRYLIEGWGSGRYRLTANAEIALETEGREVMALIGRRYREDFVLRCGFSVSGIVLGKDGTPAKQATVTLEQDGTSSTRTDGNGAFRLGGVSAGRAVVFARRGPKDGNGDRCRSVIEVDSDVAALRLTLQSSLTIRGRIRNRAGNPLAGVVIVAIHEGRFWNRQSATSRNDGSFRIDGCYEGDYRLSPFPSRGATSAEVTVSVSESSFVELQTP